MKMLKLLNFKFLLSKCLIAGILFFSFIAIAGYSGDSKLIFRQTGQTELVCMRKNLAANKTVLYRTNLLPKNQISFYSHNSNLILLLIYNELVKAKINSHSKKMHSISIHKCLFPINNIPQNSAEEILSFFES
jgi:hypothetical protein